MFVIEKTVEIAAPAAVVWEVISDLKRYPEWNPFCLACASTLKPGDPIDMTVKLMARPQQQREWMLEYVEGKRFAYQMKPVPLGSTVALPRGRAPGRCRHRGTRSRRARRHRRAAACVARHRPPPRTAGAPGAIATSGTFRQAVLRFWATWAARLRSDSKIC